MQRCLAPAAVPLPRPYACNSAGCARRLNIKVLAIAAPPPVVSAPGGNGALSLQQPAAPPAPVPPPEMAAPAGIYAKAVDGGAAKAAAPAWKQLLGGVLAGCFIAFGAALAMAVGGASPGLAASNPGLQRFLFGAVGLPFGLLMVVVTGSELFTGNTALLTVAAWEGRATLRQLLRNWAVSFAGNIVGSLAMVAGLMAAGTFAAGAATPIAVAVTKTSMSFGTVFAKGVLCNWLVCMGVWMSLGTSSFLGKALAVLVPVSMFVALGLDHSVANCFMVPLGIACGAPVTTVKFLTANLLPATLGNVVGGAVCCATVFSFYYGTPGKPKGAQ